MGRLVRGLLFFGLAAPGLATALFQGTFGADDQVQLFNITVLESETVTFQTYGYAGGTVDSTVIPGGGFAPTAFLFDNLGDVTQLFNGTCSQVGTDSTTESCDDLYFVDEDVAPGAYTLALAVDDNRPVDTSVADGFVQNGNPGFTCTENGGSGEFCDVTAAFPTDNMRTGNFAISVTGADSVSESGVPEPGSMLLLLAGGGFTALLRRRSISRNVGRE
jgi:hypothetical protein